MFRENSSILSYHRGTDKQSDITISKPLLPYTLNGLQVEHKVESFGTLKCTMLTESIINGHHFLLFLEFGLCGAPQSILLSASECGVLALNGHNVGYKRLYFFR
jgi:hypothetical protein